MYRSKENDAVASNFACRDLIDRSLVERSHQYLRKHRAHLLHVGPQVGQWFAGIIVQGRPMRIFRETLYWVRNGDGGVAHENLLNIAELSSSATPTRPLGSSR